MTIMEAVISGLVQGVTEFLPVSSSGHLVILHKLFGFTKTDIFFDVCLHAATLMAVLIYFARDILDLIKKGRINWLLYLCAGTVPAVLAGVLFESRISLFFADPRRAALMLIVTGAILFAGQIRLWNRNQPTKGPTVLSAIFVGVSQAFALIPGISRSGATISAGLVSGIKADDAFRFSFLLSIPVIAGALFYKLLTGGISAVGAGEGAGYAAGIAAAFITGLVSLRLLWWVIRSKKLFVFSAYCVIAGITGVFLLK